MFIRALLAFLALPGVVAILVPIAAAWRGSHGQLKHPAGLALLTAGCAALLWCVHDFYVSGKGTLAPWAPPTRLVTVGLYRYSRNPMYLAVFTMLLGWAVSFASPPLLVYAIAMAIAFELRVIYGEEPWLARTHGADWKEYAARVPRWLW